jgi:hypothetical protein
MPRKGKKKGRSKGTGNVNALSWLSNTNAGGANGLVQRAPADFGLRPMDMAIKQTPPKNFPSMIYWLRISFDDTISFTSTVNTGARSFQLSDLSRAVSLAANFDQYCIHSVIANFDPMMAPGSTITPGVFASAIDLDSVVVPSGPGQLEEYFSYLSMNMAPGVSQERVILPCVTPALYSGSAVFSGYAVTRSWIDSANTSVPHFGIKYAYVGSTGNMTIKVVYTYIIGYRNGV